MKTLIKNYTFNAAAKTITFEDFTSIQLKQVLVITNVTDNIIIYNFAALGGSVLNNVLTLNYNTTSMSNSDELQIFIDVPGPIYGLDNTTTTAYASSLTIASVPSVLYMLTGYNSKTSPQFIQIHDATSVPADGSVPKITFYVPAQANFSYDFGTYGRFFTTGIVVCNSSTGQTKTIGSTDCWFDAQWN